MTGHGYGSGVFDQHQAKLASSAVSVDVARERGYLSADTKKGLEDFGFSPAQRRPPALVIPLHDVFGETAGYQLRSDDPRVLDGRTMKYESRLGQKMVLDVPPRVHPHLGDPGRALLVTEGPIKADALVSAGLDAVALLGVWGWRGSNDEGGKVALAAWEQVALKGRQVYVAFDSDVMLKAPVYDAMSRFGAWLKLKGAHVAYVYLPSDAGQKVGADDYLANGGNAADLVALAVPELRKLPKGDHSDNRATPQHPSVKPPKLADDLRILDRFGAAVRRCGVVGEERNAQRLYLLITSRMLDKPVSAAVKGHSSSGKSFTTETTVRFFPKEAVIEMTAMSERALVYSKEDYKHRTLVLYEAVALREGNDDNLTSYFVRTLLSEGRIEYPVTVRDPDGNFTTKTVVKEGPTNMIVTTTKTKMHAENETRVLSLATDDSKEQTARVLLALADETDSGVDLDEWHQLQAWLQHAEHRVTIPYARQLAELVPPVAVRLRRDFGALLAMVRSHAILHQQSRDRDDRGRIVATLDDYEVVRDLMADVIAEGVGSTVSPVVRETVAAVEALAGPEGIKLQPIADRLDVDKSNASRRLRVAADGGYVTNLEDKRGKPGRWVVGDPLPDEHDLLPQLRNTPQPSDQECCGVALESEGDNTCTSPAASVATGTTSPSSSEAVATSATTAMSTSTSATTSDPSGNGADPGDSAPAPTLSGHVMVPCDQCGQEVLLNPALHGDGKGKQVWPRCYLTPGCDGRHRQPSPDEYARSLNPGELGPLDPETMF